MAFKGGTSLSKAFKLINRFSEDIDITIDPAAFKVELKLADSSRSRIKKLSVELKLQLKNYVTNEILPFLRQELKNTFSHKSFSINSDSEGEKLFIYYLSVVESSFGYLRDHILIEFGIRNSVDPLEKGLSRLM